MVGNIYINTSSRVNLMEPLFGFSEHKLQLKTPPNFDLEKIATMEGSDLAELVRHYAKENEALRKENGELFAVRDLLVRDQEMVCRENERLLRKLEEVNS